MASKTTGKPPAKPATSAKSSKPAPAKPVKAVKAAKPAPAKPAAQPSKALTRTVKKPAAAARPQRNERPARHEKPGTGRVNRGASVERMPVFESGAKPPERRIAAPVSPPVKGLASPFGKQELGEWRQMLLQHRAEISQDISHLEQGAMEAEDGHTTPNHIAERGSDAEMQDMSLGLAGEEQIVLWQIDRALRKIDSATPAPFGLCEHTKQPIPKARLQLIPWTPVSIEGMNYVEENGLALEDVLVDG
jgi:RNA polymerase-binding transcription factor DksA